MRRWLKRIPQDILEGNPWEKGTKVRVKEWVKENVRRRGADSVLWGRWEENVEWEEREEEEGAKAMDKGSPKDRNPPTSSKQMRRMGEPRRKICRVEEDQSPKASNPQNGNSSPRPPPGAEGPNVTKLTNTSRQYGNKRRAAKKRKEEFRKKRELKVKEKKEKAALKEKKGRSKRTH